MNAPLFSLTKRGEDEGPRPYRVLFLCQGNIARSAAAEIMARAAFPPGSGLEFASAGTGAVVGAGVARHIDRELESRGLEVSGHTAQQMSARLLAWADLVLPMQSLHRDWVLDEWPAAVSKTFLLRHAARLLPEDPESVGGAESGASRAAANPRAENRLAPAAWLRTNGGGALEEDDIADPYRLGSEAAGVAVERVEESLEALLPRLEHWTRESRATD